MALLPFALLAVIFGFVLFMPTTALGFVKGQPVTLQTGSIHDYGCVLRIDAANAWNRMKLAALDDGVTLKPKGANSAFRTHDQQAEMLAERPTFAAQVDYSPHQAGIAVDVDLTCEGALGWLQGFGDDYDWHPLPTDAASAKEPWHWEYHPAVIGVS